MKNVVLFIIFISLLSCATGKVNNSFPHPFEYTLIDSLPGNKDQLFVKANEWMAKTFVSAKDIIQMHDKDAGKLIGKVNIVSPAMPATNHISYIITIDIKNNKYRCTLSDFQDQMFGDLTPDHKNNLRNPVWLRIKNKANSNALTILSSLKETMHTNSDNF